jgi:hypothetical protein
VMRVILVLHARQETTLFRPEIAKNTRASERVPHVIRFAFLEVGFAGRIVGVRVAFNLDMSRAYSATGNRTKPNRTEAAGRKPRLITTERLQSLRLFSTLLAITRTILAVPAAGLSSLCQYIGSLWPADSN